MEDLKNNQILLEISEDKKHVTVTLGEFQSMTFDSCPKNANQNIGNAIDAYFRKTGLYQIPEWNNEKCVYSDGEGCSDCN